MNSEAHYQPWKPHSSGPICIPPAHWDQRTPPSGRGHPFESKNEGFSLQCFFLAGKVIEEVKNLSLHCVQASELPIKEHCFITISCVTTLQGTHPGSTHQQNYLSQVQAVSMLLINQVCGFGLDFLACRESSSSFSAPPNLCPAEKIPGCLSLFGLHLLCSNSRSIFKVIRVVR